MTTKEIQEIVNTTYAKKYRVKFADGTSKIVRLWLSKDGFPCIIDKRKRRYGHCLNWWNGETDNWVSLKEVTKNDIDYKKRLLLRAKAAQKMLAQSGLWKSIKDEIDAFLALSDEEIDEFVKDWVDDSYENIFNDKYKKEEERKFPWLHTKQVFDSFFADRCWTSPNFGRWYRTEKEQLKQAIENKRNYNLHWTEGYDNSVEVKFDSEDEQARGWYSCEYRGYGNGHYYLLFDATHAIFYEDD